MVLVQVGEHTIEPELAAKRRTDSTSTRGGAVTRPPRPPTSTSQGLRGFVSGLQCTPCQRRHTLLLVASFKRAVPLVHASLAACWESLRRPALWPSVSLHARAANHRPRPPPDSQSSTDSSTRCEHEQPRIASPPGAHAAHRRPPLRATARPACRTRCCRICDMCAICRPLGSAPNRGRRPHSHRARHQRRTTLRHALSRRHRARATFPRPGVSERARLSPAAARVQILCRPRPAFY
ncbi:hypothetical protein DMC30DRAFT_205095 [Rhodotorula diobovata]|uniref:Uncharacterized protein n=1 Tax=Rhodotorula diobovata TaxID=5288 RepID=A0A5C5FYN7_9BASI|nr:hypothetical protein DMC30DRAFT_205095 [Rhodotorula diobovata]